MARIQNADLHRLIGVHVIGEGRTGLFPSRAPGAERILDHPLPEILVADRGGVIDAQTVDQLDQAGAGGRHDAIDHGVGEAAICLDPFGEAVILQAGKAHHGLPQDIAIALQVVATLPGKRPGPAVAAGAQGGDHGTKCRARGRGVRRIMLDIRMIDVKGPGHRIDVIAALGHRQGNDADIGLRHAVDQRRVACDDGQIVDHRAHHLDRLARGGEFDQRRQVVLRRQTLPHRLVIGADACADDRPVERLSRLHQPVQIPGLMRAVEIADADMHDAGLQRGAII